MSQNQENFSAAGTTILVFSLLTGIAIKNAFIADERWYYFTLLTVPILLFEIINSLRH
jgi:hypothetical protein